MKHSAEMAKSQEILRDIERLIERLRTGHRMLQEAVKNSSIVQATKIIEHFMILNETLVQKNEELVLVQQFISLGIKGHVRRNGQYMSYDQLIHSEDSVPLDPDTLMALERVKQIFGEIPHDILHIED